MVGFFQELAEFVGLVVLVDVLVEQLPHFFLGIDCVLLGTADIVEKFAHGHFVYGWLLEFGEKSF